MRKFNTPLVVVLGALCTFLLINAFVTSDRHYAYIDNNKVFSEFKLTDEYTIKLNKIQEERSAVLDSMELRVQQKRAAISQESSEVEVLQLRKEIMELENTRKRFEEQNQILTAQYDDIIWKQLNSYIKSYGDEKGFDMILGVSGQGNLMYANGSLDVSQEVLQYVNDKYDGKN